MVIIFDFEGRERLGRAEHVIEAKDTLVNTSAHIPSPSKNACPARQASTKRHSF